MTICYHCGEEIFGEEYKCSECGQTYCSLHKDPINHDCNIVKESLSYNQSVQTQQPAYITPNSTPSYVSVPRTSPGVQDRINQQQQPPERYRSQYGATSESADKEIRGTTDGSYTWYREEKYIPDNAFDPDSGIEFKGILLSHKSEFLHLLIGSILIYLIGLLSFYNPSNQRDLESIGFGWAVFMLAGFYTTAFLFHEFGHRQVARHFGFQTKFRLLTFGMVLTAFSLISSLFSFFSGSLGLPSIALPGAVVVLGLDKVDRKTGLCKAAGPTVNLIYGTILLIISFIIPRDLYPLNLFFGLAAILNCMLGLFNMIPLGILDGQNIFKWNKQVYIMLSASLLLLLIIAWANVYAPPDVNIYYPKELQDAYKALQEANA